MKRIFYHVLFWVAYFIQYVVLEFHWVSPALSRFPEWQQIWMSALTGLSLLVPKMIFTYFILYYGLNRLLKEKSSMIANAIIIGSVLFGCLVIYSIIYTYLVYPVIFQGALNHPGFMDIRQVLFGMMDIGFVSGAAVAIRLLKRQLAGKEIEKNLVREKLETELKFLRSQTNPHFLFNTLNNIYGLARKKSDETAAVVMKLSGILRFMLYESGKDFITVAEEIKIIDDYLELEKIRYNERLSISFITKIDKPTQQVSPLLLLPFIENAFKHGVSNTRFNSFIKIAMEIENGRLDFVVENTKGDASTGREGGQIGLNNAKRQLELMYREYKLEVEDFESTFKIKLLINLNSHAKI